MAKIQTVTLASGKKRYRFVLDAGPDPRTGKRRQRKFTYDRLADAKAELARMSNDVNHGQFVDRWKGTVDDLCDAYLKWAAYGKADNTRVSYTTALLPVRERLGQRPAQSVTREDIESLRDWMLSAGRKRGGKPGSGLGPRSVRLTLGRLSAAFTLAIRDRRLSANPCAYVALPAQGTAERPTWGEGEARRFLEVAAEDRLHAAWRMTMYGARRGEVLGLMWPDIDLDAKTVSIGRSRVLAGGRVIVKDPKSAKGFRTVPLDNALVTALRELRKRQATERLAAGHAYEASGYVVVDELGAPVHPERFTDEFHRVAGLAGCPRIRLHDGRHTTNSLLAAAGIPAHIRAAWCGHTVAVNVATYTHARPEDLIMARDALSKIYGAV
jgi:integrase